MSEQKRYYWIKLKTDFFNQEAVDLLLSQPNGCQYVVLYQMLCLKTANNNGEMTTRVGEMIVPYNIDKIVRDTKYFDHDTVTVALELFKRLGLIYQEENGVLRITDSVTMVGHESASREAIKKREYRMRKLLEDTNGDKKGTNCPTEIRDRVKSIDIDIDNKEKINKKKSSSRFSPPSIEEVMAYCSQRNNSINAEQFVDFYASKGWKVGNTPMKDWKAAVRTWEQRDNGRKKPQLSAQEQEFIKELQDDVERF